MPEHSELKPASCEICQRSIMKEHRVAVHSHILMTLTKKGFIPPAYLDLGSFALEAKVSPVRLWWKSIAEHKQLEWLVCPYCYKQIMDFIAMQKQKSWWQIWK